MNTIIVLDNDYVVGCAFSTQTLIRRLKNATEGENPFAGSTRFQGMVGNDPDETDVDEAEINKIETEEQEENEEANIDDDESEEEDEPDRYTSDDL